ncbi:hypothetical protein OK016_24895 [Vibrio chagasii]|nr:hypothetical protein [Vibrio chagasii]
MSVDAISQLLAATVMEVLDIKQRSWRKLLLLLVAARIISVHQQHKAMITLCCRPQSSALDHFESNPSHYCLVSWSGYAHQKTYSLETKALSTSTSVTILCSP